MCYISARPERYSYGLIQKNREYVIKLTTRSLVFATDWCGVKSDRQVDKFKELGLPPSQPRRSAHRSSPSRP